jgi:hypothetical protein
VDPNVSRTHPSDKMRYLRLNLSDAPPFSVLAARDPDQLRPLQSWSIMYPSVSYLTIMKLPSSLTVLCLCLGVASMVACDKEKKVPAGSSAGHDHDHDHHHDHDHAHDHVTKAGPTGGKLITGVEPNAEFFVNKDKKVEIRFVDKANKVIAPGAQVVSVILGDRTKPVKLTFTRDGDSLVSDGAVPEGNDHPTVVQIKTDEAAKAVTAKFNLNLTKCPTCPNSEYACVCDHDHDHAGEGKK